MEPQKAHLSKLFDGKVRYFVPNYQRLYVWRRQDQWEPLWMDVRELADALVKHARALRQPGGIDESVVDPHFMGAVVLKSSGPIPDLATQWRVIDGQQRITTLQLLLAAAERAIRDLDEMYADRLLELIINPGRGRYERNASLDPSQLKVSFQRHKRGRDHESFGPVLHAALASSGVDEIGGPLADCYRYFRNTIREWLDPHPARELAAAALGATLLSKIFVVGLYLDDHEKEHIIFETLNARGEPLTEWDKAKNYLLYLADESSDLDPGVVFEDYLDRFDDQWWRQSVGRGAQSRPRSDVFLDYWLESKTGSPVPVRRVYRRFQAYLESRRHDTGLVLEELVHDAGYFRKWDGMEEWDSSRESLFHFRRREIGLGAVWPLLLRLHNIVSNQGERGRCLAVLESYFVHRMICGRLTSGYNQVAMDLLNELPDGAKNDPGTADTLRGKLLGYTEGSTLWPDDDEIRSAMLTRWMPRYVRGIVLSAIERKLTSSVAGWQADVARLSTLHIEHIMPVGWTEPDWPLPGSGDRETARQDRDAVIQTIGNLTLLHERLNQTVSNSAWPVKRGKFSECDNLFLNRRLLKDAGGDWTESDIRARGEWMYEQLKEIWRRPKGIPIVHRPQPAVADPETEAFFQRYWTEFARFMEERDSAVRAGKPSRRYWITFAIGRTGFHMSAVLWRAKNRIGVELNTRGPNAHAHLVHLQGNAAIESALGPGLKWRHLPKSGQLRLVSPDLIHPEDPDDWLRQHQWLAETLEKFDRVLRPRIADIDVLNSPPGEY